MLLHSSNSYFFMNMFFYLSTIIISERFKKSIVYDAARENDEEILCDDVNV